MIAKVMSRAKSEMEGRLLADMPERRRFYRANARVRGKR